MTLYKTFGGLSLDQSGESASSLFDSLDPAHENLIAWTKAVMNAELLAKGWTTATVGTKLENLNPVESTLNRNVDPELLKAAKFQFPLLYLYSPGGESQQFTLELSRSVTNWRFGYVLGTGTPPEYQSVAGVLRTFPRLIAAMFSARAHASYDSGEPQLQTGKVDFSSVQLVRWVQGAAAFGQQGDGVTFHMAEAEVRTTEVEGAVPNVHPDLIGFDVTAAVDGQGDFVQGQADIQ